MTRSAYIRKIITSVVAVAMLMLAAPSAHAESTTSKVGLSCGLSPADLTYWQSTFAADASVHRLPPILGDPLAFARSKYRLTVITQYIFCDYVNPKKGDKMIPMNTQDCVQLVNDRPSNVIRSINFDSVVYDNTGKRLPSPKLKFGNPDLHGGEIKCSTPYNFDKFKKMRRADEPKVYAHVKFDMVGYEDVNIVFHILGDNFKRMDPIVDFNIPSSKIQAGSQP